MSLEAAWELLGAMLCGALIGMQREFLMGKRAVAWPAPPGVCASGIAALLVMR